MLKAPPPFSKNFFERYFTPVPPGIETDLDEEPVCITLLRKPGYGFQLSVWLAGDSVDLTLLHPAFENAREVGWSDLAHPMPEVLRVEEAEAFCSGVTVLPATQHAEAVARVLLSPFTMPTRSNEERQCVAMERSLSLLGFTGDEIRLLRGTPLPERVPRRRRLDWVCSSARWYVAGDYPNSLRRAEKPDFPHRELSEVIGDLPWAGG